MYDLEIMFLMQYELRKRTIKIESINKLCLVKQIESGIQGHIPQQKLKNYAWNFTEELGEFLDSPSEAERNSEIIDALHFLIEICIASGIKANQIAPSLAILCDHSVEIRTNRSLTERAYTNEELICDIILKLSRAMNLLKCRAWKIKPSFTKFDEFLFHIQSVWIAFISLCVEIKIEDQLLELYKEKNRINHARIDMRC